MVITGFRVLLSPYLSTSGRQDNIRDLIIEGINVISEVIQVFVKTEFETSLLLLCKSSNNQQMNSRKVQTLYADIYYNFQGQAG